MKSYQFVLICGLLGSIRDPEHAGFAFAYFGILAIVLEASFKFLNKNS